MSSQQAKQIKKQKEQIKQEIEFVTFLQKQFELVMCAYDASVKIGANQDNIKKLRDIINDKVSKLHAVYFKDAGEQDVI